LPALLILLLQMPHNDMDTAMAEAEMVMTGVFGDLMDRTGG
jgi:hypothetical protein